MNQKNDKYVVTATKDYSCKVTVVKHKDTGVEYINYVLKVGKYDIPLSLRNYSSITNEVVKNDLKG